MAAADSSAAKAAGIRRADQKRRAGLPDFSVAALVPAPGRRRRTEPPARYRMEGGWHRWAAARCSRSSHPLLARVARTHRVQCLDRHHGHIHAGPCPEPFGNLPAHCAPMSDG